VTEARQELDSVRKVVQTAIKAPRAGIAHPYVRAGASVHAGQLLAEIQ
jgi:predicted deacylase